MKIRLFVGLSAVALVIAALAFSAQSFRAGAQDLKREPLIVAPASYVAPMAPTTGIVQVSATAPASVGVSPTLPELIANLKELRKQELQLTTAIKEKIKAQKKALDAAENELKALDVDALITPVAPTPLPSVPPLQTAPVTH